MPPLRFFRSQLAQHEAPAVTYYIRGTSTNVNGTETFNIQFIDDGSQTPNAAEQITCAVDGNGNWEYVYRGKKVYSFYGGTTPDWGFASNKTTLLTCDFSQADDFSRLVSFGTNNTGQNYGVFANCVNLTSVVFGTQTFENTVLLGGAFYGCTSLTSIDLSNATFALATNLDSMFYGCTSLTSIDLSNATFASAKNINAMFMNCSALTTLDIHNISFSNATSASYMFNGCSNLVSLNIDSMDLSNVTIASFFIRNCGNLANIQISVNNGYTAPNSTSGFNIAESPLTYQSMLNIANWLPTTTSSRNVTFKSSAWNALTTAEKNTLDGIISGKNWTRAIA